MSLIITASYDSSFQADEYKIGSSISSKYFPLVNFNNKEYISENFPNDEVIYHKPAFGKTSSIYRFIINDFINHLNKYEALTKYLIGKNDDGTPIYLHVAKGYIVDNDNNILLMLCKDNTKEPSFNFSTQIWQYTNVANGREYYPYLKDLNHSNHFKLLISNELLKDKRYALFYKKLEKAYIIDAYKNDIDVIFTTSKRIEEESYSNEFHLRFNTVEQLKSHLDNLVPSLLFLTDRDYRRGSNPSLHYSLNDRNDIYMSPAPPSVDTIDDLSSFVDSFLNNTSPVLVNLIDDVEDLPF